MFLFQVSFDSSGFGSIPISVKRNYFTFLALAALSLVYVVDVIGIAQLAVQMFSEVENHMTSVERVMTYTEIEPEPGYDIEMKPPKDWPCDARITLNDVSLKYHPGGPQVLKNLNVNIKAKANIRVAGRTGAGKSSLMAAILRMPEPKGIVTVDGVNLATINLQESRRCISVLSQNPVLFSGPVRKNLDPLRRHEDAQLWRILEEVQLKSLVEHLEGHLDYEVSEGGGNFSVGEKQLLCLARVLLQQNKVLILDEPTAHVDPGTERTIQTTIRNQLEECTVITVAHRLSTIRDCDKILVMEDGSAVEFDGYDQLMRKENGVFADIANKQC